jgi:hypothetical protein
MPFFFVYSYGIILLMPKKRFAYETGVGLSDREKKILCRKRESITPLGMIDCGLE